MPVPSPRSLPRPLAAAGALVAALAALLAGLGGYLVVAGLISEPSSRADAEIAGAITLLAGGSLALVARGLFRRRRWARSPAVVTALVTLPVAWSLLQAGQWLVGAALLAAAAALLGLLFSPAVSAALTEERYDGHPAG